MPSLRHEAHRSVVPQGTAWRGLAHRFRRNLLSVGGLAVVAVFVFTALSPGLVAWRNPLAVDPGNRLLAPAVQHYFGTDELGRDLFSRVVYGIRISLLSALVSVLGATVIGAFLGIIAGYAGGALDELVMRISDVFISFPTLILAMALVAVLGPGLLNAMLAVIFVWWPQYARLTRAQVLTLTRLVYVEAARSLGLTRGGILRRHILPNALPIILVKGSLDIGSAILITAGLSFLGMGVQPPTPELGALVTAGRGYLLSAWWYPTFPGLAIFAIVLSFNLLGDGLRDVLDPTLR